MTASIWRVEMLGGLKVIGRDREITRFRTQKTACLLAYLAYQLQRIHPREVLCEALWPEGDPDLSRQNLRQALSSLRHQLEPPGIPQGSILVTDRFRARLNPAAVSTDVQSFQDLLRQAERADSAPERREMLRQAVHVYRGELLPGFYDNWVIREQDALFQDYTKAVCDLVELLAEGDGQDEASSLLKRSLSIYPASTTLQRLASQLLVSPKSRSGDIPPMVEHSAPSPAPEVKEAPLVSRPPYTELPATLLPPSFTRFFGREGEIADLRRFFQRGERLVTLTGPGGTGKTRLALESARTLEPDFPGAVWFVPLAGLSDPAQIMNTIRSAMALPSADTDPLEQVAFILDKRTALLVLDNFEQIVDGGAEIVQRLLLRIPTLSLLVTSRRLLSLSAERAFPVPPLPVPEDITGPEQLLQCRSIQLFVDRAQAVRPDFQVTANNSETLACLCVRLEGIPLALELAAARSAIIPPARMLSELEHRFDVLVSRKRDADPRHQTLKAAIDWSYHLLDPKLRSIFRRLSVFQGGWTEEAAKFICDEPGTWDALEELAENSLILVEETDLEPRFRMLETLREYGWDLMDEPERWELRRRHRDWVLRLAEEAGPGSRGPKYREWFERLENEHENVRTALAFCREDPHGAEAAMFIIAALSWFWTWRGHREEGWGMFRAALAHPGLGEETTGLAMELVTRTTMTRGLQGNIAWSLEAMDQTITVLRRTGPVWALVDALLYFAVKSRSSGQPVPASIDDEAMALAFSHNLTAMIPWALVMLRDEEAVPDALEYARQAGNREAQVEMLCHLAKRMGVLGDVDRAWSLFGEARDLCKEINDPGLLITVNREIGCFWADCGDFEQAMSHHREAEAISRSIGDLHQLTFSLDYLGNGAREQGDYPTARRYYEEQRALLEQHGYPENTYLLHNLGRLAATEGDVPQGRALLLRALALNRASDRKIWEANNLLVLGNIARREGELSEARRSLTDCLGIWRRTGPQEFVAYALEAFACLSEAEGNPRASVRLYGAAEALRRAIRKAMQPEDRPEHEAALARARAALGYEAFVEAWENGQAMSGEQAVDYALGGAESPTSNP